jgi:hypothetical protein
MLSVVVAGGVDVGACVGEGFAVGACVGEGFTVGACVGEGFAVGACVGLVVGDDVALPVGPAVGATVRCGVAVMVGVVVVAGDAVTLVAPLAVGCGVPKTVGVPPLRPHEASAIDAVKTPMRTLVRSRADVITTPLPPENGRRAHDYVKVRRSIVASIHRPFPSVQRWRRPPICLANVKIAGLLN